MNSRERELLNEVAGFFKNPQEAQIELGRAFESGNPVLTSNGHLDENFVHLEEGVFKVNGSKPLDNELLSKHLRGEGTIDSMLPDKKAESVTA